MIFNVKSKLIKNYLVERKVTETRILKVVSLEDFKEIITRVKGRISVNSHAYFRLSEMQRKIYKESSLIELLTTERPKLVGFQANKNYAVFFGNKEGYLRVIFKLDKDKIEIITFYITDHAPKI